MAGYFDHIPRQLAARRVALAAARANRDLLSGCNAVIRSIAGNMFDFMTTLVVNAAVFPDRPLYFDLEAASFLNFGASPRLLEADRRAIEAEAAGGAAETLSKEGRADVRRLLSLLAARYAVDHHATRVYNLEPWLQDLYRDRMRFDRSDALRRRREAVLAGMKAFPRLVFATGLAPDMARGVLDALRLFTTIADAAHKLTREKMSITDRRSYVDTVRRITVLMERADASLGTAGSRVSEVRRLFEMWKEYIYEIMLINRRLREAWRGADLDRRIRAMADMFRAVQAALRRCAEEGTEPSPLLPLLPADMDISGTPDRKAVTKAFHQVMRFDFITGSDMPSRAREALRYGPLGLIIAPGSGQPRYCREMRRLRFPGTEEEGKKTRPDEGAEGMLRRLRQPVNFLISPLGADGTRFAAGVTGAWLEYCREAFPVRYTEVVEKARSLAPVYFGRSEDRAVPAAEQALAALTRLTSAFAAWAATGVEPDGDGAPGWAAFREAMLARLDRGLLLPFRHRALLDIFAEAGEERRSELWRHVLGPRFDLDRQLVAAQVMLRDWNGLRESLVLLPPALQSSPQLGAALAKVAEETDAFSVHRAVEALRRFLQGDRHLAAAAKAVDKALAAEVATLRRQAEGLERKFDRDEAGGTILRRLVSRIQARRMEANKHIDGYLVGLMHALDNNLPAAERALAMCRSSGARGPALAELTPPPEAGEDAAWFGRWVRHAEEHYPSHPVPGESGPGMEESEFLHYNLGIVYSRLKQPVAARMCFKTARDDASGATPYLCRVWAGDRLRDLEEEERPGNRSSGE